MMFTERLVWPPDFCLHQIDLYYWMHIEQLASLFSLDQSYLTPWYCLWPTLSWSWLTSGSQRTWKCRHHDYFRMTSGWIQDDFRMNSGWTQDDFRMTYEWTQNNIRLTSGGLQGDFRMTSQWTQDDFRMTSGWLQDDIRITSGWLQDDFRMTSG